MENSLEISQKDCYERLSNVSSSLKSLRKENFLTQKQVAERIGVKYQSYQAYERGVSYPSLENFVKLSLLFKVSLDYLIGREIY